jgi:uncharacterized damage-inducible protein DinB
MPSGISSQIQIFFFSRNEPKRRRQSQQASGHDLCSQAKTRRNSIATCVSSHASNREQANSVHKLKRRIAVSEMTAEQAQLFVHTALLGVLKNESRTTRSVLAAVPNLKLDFRPDPYARTANELLRHIASADNFFLKSVVDGVFVPGSVRIPDNVTTPKEVADWYEDEYVKNFDAVSRASGEQLIKIINFRGLFEAPAYTFLQAGLLHTVHHRGQLSSYLRSMGGRVPAIYGESYDSAEARKASQVPA